jgi:ornithine cyclodeaminase
MQTNFQEGHNADTICTVTSSPTPIAKGEWLRPSVHINAVGACQPTTRELDSCAVARTILVVDSRESTLNEAGEFLIARDEGLIDEGHVVGEPSEVVQGRILGRTSKDDITLFKSLGIAAEDIAAACCVYEAALQNGVGTQI